MELELRGITKRFPGVLANDQVSLTARSGKVLAQIPEVLDAYLVSGDYDYFLRIATSTHGDGLGQLVNAARVAEDVLGKAADADIEVDDVWVVQVLDANEEYLEAIGAIGPVIDITVGPPFIPGK